MGEALTWQAAMSAALYGEDGFFTGADTAGPAAAGRHFRTSVQATPLFASAVLRLVTATDEALGRPRTLDIVDIGAGGGRLLRQLAQQAPAYLARRLRLTAVEQNERPADLPTSIQWRHDQPGPDEVQGVLLATEWLDNVPINIAEADPAGVLRYVLVDPYSGAELFGEPLGGADLEWARTWWSDQPWRPGARIELGGPRDEAWAGAVASVRRGLAVTVDYGHLWYARPLAGSLTAFRGGRETDAIPDGSRDITAHVAIDSACAAGEAVAGQPAALITQRQALAALGLDGARPDLRLASREPIEYVRALAQATQAAELMDISGLGGHYWIVQPVDVPGEALPAGLRLRA